MSDLRLYTKIGLQAVQIDQLHAALQEAVETGATSRARAEQAEKALHDIRVALEPVSGEGAYGGIPSLQKAVDAVWRVLAEHRNGEPPPEWVEPPPLEEPK